MRRALLVVVCALCPFLLIARGQAQDVASPAQAESSTSPRAEPSEAELAKARALFQRGVQLTSSGDYSAGAERFRAALRIRWAPAVEYNLAAALFELANYREAFNSVQSVLKDPETTSAVRERALRLERSLVPYVARLTVVTGGDGGNLSVRVDGEPLSPVWLGIPRAVAPGTHQVAAERDGETITVRELQIPRSTATIFDVSLIVREHEIAMRAQAEQAVQPSGQTRESTPSTTPDGAPRSKRWRWAVAIASGVVAVGVGVTLGVLLSKDGAKPQSPVAGTLKPGVLTWN